MVMVGDIYRNKVYGEYEVVGYKNCYNVTVEFKNTGNRKVVQAGCCIRGKAADTKFKEDSKVERLQGRVGEVYQDLKVTSYSGDRSYIICQCRCGKVVLCSEYNLLNGHDKSCGCKLYLKDPYSLYEKHPSERSSYESMLTRCKYFNAVNRKYYWDKNITACDRWLVAGVEGFRNFLEDMGTKPDTDYQLDRVDTDGDYCKENCRWVSRKVNMSNRGITVKVAVLSNEVPLRYILDMLELDHCTVRDRYNSGLPFTFVFYKGSLRRNTEYKQYKKANNVSIKKLSSSLGGGAMVDPDTDKTFEKLYADKILNYVEEEHGVVLQ